MDLVAIKDIGQGEEITICYLNKVPQFKDFLLVSQQERLLSMVKTVSNVSWSCWLASKIFEFVITLRIVVQQISGDLVEV